MPGVSPTKFRARSMYAFFFLHSEVPQIRSGAILGNRARPRRRRSRRTATRQLLACCRRQTGGCSLEGQTLALLAVRVDCRGEGWMATGRRWLWVRRRWCAGLGTRRTSMAASVWLRATADRRWVLRVLPARAIIGVGLDDDLANRLISLLPIRNRWTPSPARQACRRRAGPAQLLRRCIRHDE